MYYLHVKVKIIKRFLTNMTFILLQIPHVNIPAVDIR